MPKSGKLILAVAAIIAVSFGAYRLLNRDNSINEFQEKANVFRAKMDALLRRHEAGEDVADELMEVLDAFTISTQRAGDRAGGHEAKLIRARLVSMRDLPQAVQRYDICHEAIEAAGWFIPRTLRTKEDIVTRLTMLEKLDAANEALDKVQTSIPEMLRSELLRSGIDADETERLVSSMKAGAGSDVMRQIRQCDREMLAIVKTMLVMDRDHWGRWELNPNGKIRFEDERLNSEYYKLQEELLAVIARQDELQNELLQPRPK